MNLMMFKFTYHESIISIPPTSFGRALCVSEIERFYEIFNVSHIASYHLIGLK